MHRFANARTVVRRMILVLSLAGTASAGLAAALAGDADAEKQASQERKEKYETWMREFAEGTRIRIRSPGVAENEAQVVAHPIFRYSGDNIHADDATLWVWTHQARAVAFQKIEVNNIPHMVNHERGELNPILLLLIESRRAPDGKLRWEYASRRLGIWSATLKLDGEKVSFAPVVRMSDQIQDDWTFYFMPRDFD